MIEGHNKYRVRTGKENMLCLMLFYFLNPLLVNQTFMSNVFLPSESGAGKANIYKVPNAVLPPK